LLVLGLIITFIVHTRVADTQTTGVCPTLVQNALEQVEQLCAGTGRNQICYGNSVLVAEPRAEITDVLLSTPGDMTEIQNLSRVMLFPMDIDLGQWGVALMRVQANLPDTLPGQNVLFLLFGDVELTPELPQLILDNSQASVNAFRLRTGVTAPQCDAAPPDGIIIQTPHGAGRIELTLNGVDLSLGSTVYFSAQASGYLAVNTLEGSAQVNAAGIESYAPAGTVVYVPLNEDLTATAPPLLPQPYDATELNRLPLAALERPIRVHPPLLPEEVIAVQQTVLESRANAAQTQAASGCSGNLCDAQAPGGGNPGQGGGNSGGNGNGGNNPNGNGGNCPGNSCNSNGAAGNGGSGDSDDDDDD
jgi:hypothetical protein